ncbi:response regulator transcription factor [Arcanobacterium hippocoleae]|uniref:DNA-binding NarL/FixJ family response regulator n=1 Tax=Arcanobacterium hippocoleae TaxID=149017 RepID=A0ABU1SZT2_9ACTO|nr:response regulator transcription factor [Arcanobacterium hippocoleae]MDR6938632.1 DNA-binding NarL/FixJ family response regulator [Arcanobacterium hippocoleae]
MKIIIVDDHDLVRSGIRVQLEQLSAQNTAQFSASANPENNQPIRYEVVGEAADVDSAVNVITNIECDLVLLDVHLPGGAGGGGAEVVRRVHAICKNRVSAPAWQPKFLALSVSDAASDVVSVIRAGARGYVTKSISSSELTDAMNRVASGDAAFSPRLAGFVLDAFGSGATEVAQTDAELDRLSIREQEVMRYIARGYTYREVASELFISIKTVESHVSAVLRKLQLSNRRELTRWAAARGIE